MNRFSSKDNVKRIDLGEGDFIDMPAVISFEDAEKLSSGGNNLEVTRNLIKAWNLKDETGKVVEITDENLKRLDVRIHRRLTTEIIGLMSVPKAASPESGKPSGEAGPAKS